MLGIKGLIKKVYVVMIILSFFSCKSTIDNQEKMNPEKDISNSISSIHSSSSTKDLQNKVGFSDHNDKELSSIEFIEASTVYPKGKSNRTISHALNKGDDYYFLSKDYIFYYRRVESHFEIIKALNLGKMSHGMVRNKDFLYVLLDSEVLILSIEQDGSPRIVGRFGDFTNPGEISYINNTLIVTDFKTLYIYDCIDAMNPIQKNLYSTNSWAYEITFNNGLYFLNNGYDIMIFKILNDFTVVPIQEISTISGNVNHISFGKNLVITDNEHTHYYHWNGDLYSLVKTIDYSIAAFDSTLYLRQDRVHNLTRKGLYIFDVLEGEDMLCSIGNQSNMQGMPPVILTNDMLHLDDIFICSDGRVLTLNDQDIFEAYSSILMPIPIMNVLNIEGHNSFFIADGFSFIYDIENNSRDVNFPLSISFNPNFIYKEYSNIFLDDYQYRYLYNSEKKFEKGLIIRIITPYGLDDYIYIRLFEGDDAKNSFIQSSFIDKGQVFFSVNKRNADALPSSLDEGIYSIRISEIISKIKNNSKIDKMIRAFNGELKEGFVEHRRSTIDISEIKIENISGTFLNDIIVDIPYIYGISENNELTFYNIDNVEDKNSQSFPIESRSRLLGYGEYIVLKLDSKKGFKLFYKNIDGTLVDFNYIIPHDRFAIFGDYIFQAVQGSGFQILSIKDDFNIEKIYYTDVSVNGFNLINGQLFVSTDTGVLIYELED